MAPKGGAAPSPPPRDEQGKITGQGRPRSPKTVQSAEGGEGKDKRERIVVVVRSPCQESCPADAHPSAHKSVLELANREWSRTRCIWMHRVNGTGNSPSPGQPTPGVVKQDKSSGGSVDTTKTRSGPQRVRMSSGERPIGATKGKQSDTEALCHPPPPGTPPPSGPRFHRGKKWNFQTEVLLWAIFGTHTFGFQTPPPPALFQHIPGHGGPAVPRPSASTSC